MQVVDVLRDHGRRLAGAVETGERKVPATGLGGEKLRVHGKAPPPSFVAHRLAREELVDRKSTRLNSSHSQISYAVFCLKKKKKQHRTAQTERPRATTVAQI